MSGQNLFPGNNKKKDISKCGLLKFVSKYGLFYVLPCVILLSCISVLLALQSF